MWRTGQKSYCNNNTNTNFEECLICNIVLKYKRFKFSVLSLHFAVYDLGDYEF